MIRTGCITILLLVCCAHTMRAQQTFNRIYENTETDDALKDEINFIDEVNDTLYAIGMSNREEELRDGALWRFLPDGTLIDKIRLLPLTEGWDVVTVLNGQGVTTEDGFVITFHEAPNDGPEYLHLEADSLMKINRSGEIIWKTSIQSDTVCCHVARTLLVNQLENLDLLTLGNYWDRADEGVVIRNRVKGLITRFDPQGTMIWQTVVDSMEYISDVVESIDGGLIILGRNNDGDGSGLNPIAVRLSAEGTPQWRFVFANEGDLATYSESPAYGERLADGSIFLICADKGPDLPPRGPYLHERLIDLGAEGYEIVESYHRDNRHLITKTPGGVTTLSNGNLLMFGTEGVVIDDWVRHPLGSFLVLNQDLDSLYSMTYSYLELFEFFLEPFHYFYDFKELSNGDFLFGGYIRRSPQDPDQPQVALPWLVRTDSMGCIEPGCQNIVGLREQVIGLDGVVSVYPNPVQAGGALTVEFNPLGTGAAMPYIHEATSLRLYDMRGREHHRETLPPTGDPAGFIHRLQVTDLSSGQYILHWMSEAGVWYDSTPVVVE